MKLIDLLVKELPSRGGWPEGYKQCVQDSSGRIKFFNSWDLECVDGYWRGTPEGNLMCYSKYDVEGYPVCDNNHELIVTREQYEAAIAEAPTTVKHSAHSFLEKGVKHMKDRAAQRDSEDGERSMKACVDAFNAMFGHNLTETQGWQFMVLLKMARSRKKFNPDDYEDGAAYTGLAGEAHSNEQN